MPIEAMMSAAPTSTRPLLGRMMPSDERHDAADEHGQRAERPAIGGALRRLAVPAGLGHVLLEPILEAVLVLAEVEQPDRGRCDPDPSASPWSRSSAHASA